MTCTRRRHSSPTSADACAQRQVDQRLKRLLHGPVPVYRQRAHVPPVERDGVLVFFDAAREPAL